MSEQDILQRLDQLERGQIAVQQALYGPPGYPNGIVGDIKAIKVKQERDREAAAEETRDVRRSIRNLALSALASGALVVLGQYLTQ